MNHIPKEDIKSITVYLRPGRKILVETPVQGKHPTISFGVASNPASERFRSTYFETTDQGENLNIFAHLDEYGEEFNLNLNSFKIFLPEDCPFTYRFIDP